MEEKTEYQSIDLKNLIGRPLNDIEKKYAPPIIYYKGKITLPLPCVRVSIIGTRQPTKEGLLAAEEVSRSS